jgi:large conductance mechanosensitive channel
MSLIKEFKDFAMRGNVLDMAVGVIIGGAFGKIVSSLVSDVIMPPIGVLLGGVDFSGLKVIIKKAAVAADGAAIPEVSINYGVFINTLIDFIIIAFSIFLVIKGVNSLQKKKAEEPAAPPAPSKEEELLTEIRDILKSKK